MSIFSARPVAAGVARLMQLGVRLGSARSSERARMRLPEYSGRTESLQIPASFGLTTATVYRPETNGLLPAVHLNLHGGGYVLDLTTMDDPACRQIGRASCRERV